MKLGLLLIALGYGYKIYVEAQKEKGNLRSLGQWVGALMMAVSLVAGSFLIYMYWSGCDFKMGCPFKAGKAQWGHSMPAMTAPEPEEK